MGPIFLSHLSSLEHDTGGHPEQPARMRAIESAVSGFPSSSLSRLDSPAVSPSSLEAVHPPEYISAISRFCAAGGGHLDLDTVVSQGSYVAALHAAGGAVELARMLLAGEAPCGFSAHRPPGHHAPAARAMGFCLFNSIAVAARWALSGGGCSRVLILDWDVHHGNGTQDIFYGSPEVLFVSIHESPLYPGTGGAGEVGSGEGRGFTVNLPVPAGSGDSVFAGLVREVFIPLARVFSPELVLVSAGYDAHALDTLAGCQVSTEGYGVLTRLVLGAGAELGVPVGFVLEGGYSLQALEESVAATVGEMVSGPELTSDAPAAEVPLVAAARERVAELWPALAG